MFELIKDHQLNIMLGLSSVCFMVGLFAMMTKVLPKRRKFAIVDIEFSAAVLLFSDRLAYIYHGNTSELGFWMVRITNFLVFFMTISVVHSFNLYLTDLCRNEIELENVPLRLRIVELITGAGWLLVIISQFTGLYYSFDANNGYQRGPGFLICYLIPFAALFIQLSVIIQYVRHLSLYISIPVILFTVIPMMASILQAMYYGVSLTNMAIVGMAVVLYIFAIIEMNNKLEEAQQKQLEAATRKNLSIRTSLEQVISAVVRALDDKDRYSRGHSLRVAEYSKEIAKALGMDERECFRVYNSAALHDIGKIGLPESVVLRSSKLTDAEKETLKKHSSLGGRILAEVEEMPFLKDAALYHHERYDGNGYPNGLRGEDIPLYARIVAVANAYDEMTSFKPGRKPLAQGKVRETLLGGAGREFDPKIVGIMVDMLDRDTDYVMRESEDASIEESDRNDIRIVNRMHFDNYREQVSDGIMIMKNYLKIRFETRPDAGFERKNSLPSLILFDSFDRCVHRNERNVKNLHYFEFGEIWMDGHTITTSARDINAAIANKVPADSIDANEWIAYEIEAVSIKDHVKIKISSAYMSADVTVALPDATRFVYLGLTGEHCSVKNISVKELSLNVNENTITRIAPEVSFFTHKDGDIPNIEIDGYRETYSAGIPVEDGMRLQFRSMSLPVADLVHHCAYILLYSSDDGNVNGKNYSEYSCIRLDGEDATEEGKGEIRLTIHKDDDFDGWDAWKLINKRGLDHEIEFSRRKNRITFKTENAGISIECLTVVPNGVDNVYAAITGDLCAVMDIRVR